MKKPSQDTITKLAQRLLDPKLSIQDRDKIAVQLANRILKVQKQQLAYKPRKNLLAKIRYYQKSFEKYAKATETLVKDYNFKNDFSYFAKTKGRMLKDNTQLKRHLEEMKAIQKRYGLKPKMSLGEVTYNVQQKIRFANEDAEFKYKVETTWEQGIKYETMKAAYDAIKFGGVRDISVFKRNINKLKIRIKEKQAMLAELTNLIKSMV